jgi:hypothetical protein
MTHENRLSMHASEPQRVKSREHGSPVTRADFLSQEQSRHLHGAKCLFRFASFDALHLCD